MKDDDKNESFSHFMYWHVSKLCGRTMLQNLLIVSFKQVGNTSKFSKGFIKN